MCYSNISQNSYKIIILVITGVKIYASIVTDSIHKYTHPYQKYIYCG